MVPTEILAVQHYQHLTSLLDKIDGDECKPNIALLTGSTSTRESRMIRNVSCYYLVLTLFKLPLCSHLCVLRWQGLKAGEIAMVIGTHSLIADKTEFSALRISVIDEQQRFGVVQRGRFNSKVSY